MFEGRWPNYLMDTLEGTCLKKSFKAFDQDTQIFTISVRTKAQKLCGLCCSALKLPRRRCVWLFNGTTFIQIGQVVPKIWTIRSWVTMLTKVTRLDKSISIRWSLKSASKVSHEAQLNWAVCTWRMYSLWSWKNFYFWKFPFLEIYIALAPYSKTL